MRVGLVQINSSFSGQNYLPYSVGLLQAYVRRHAARPEQYEFTLPLYTRLPVGEAVEHLRGVDVAAFSTYVWNIRISLEIARRLKEQCPDTLIVFGGPQVPDRTESFLRAHPFVDVAVNGEGEQAFLGLLERFPSRDWTGLGSLSYIAAGGAFVATPRAPRLKDLDTLPSPYLEGVFEALVAAKPHERWLALWETNRGCPFSCTFCDWGSAVAAKVYSFDVERLYREVDWFADHRIEFVFCCDANFGILPRDLDIVAYVADVKRRRGVPQALSVQNTKNATERAYAAQKLLADAGLNKGVTISLQSVDPGTLKAIKRQNISSESFQELQRRFTRDGIETYSDMILGLPGETYESFVDGVCQVIENGQHNRIQFNNLSILPNAEMGDPEYQVKYGMVTVESAIINVHGSLTESADEVHETQQLVVATATTPREDWVRTRAFSWMTALLHFDKIIQIPLILAHDLGAVPYRDLLEAFDGRYDSFPVLSEVRAFFAEKARDIQGGGPEYCRAEPWLNIWWPADEYVLIKLTVENKLAEFYREAEAVLVHVLQARAAELPPRLLHEAVELNSALLKLPFQTEDLEVKTSSNLWEFYRAALSGASIPLEARTCVYHVDRMSMRYATWADWCREVIWYGNKKGAYLYGTALVERQLAGHF